MPRKNKLNFTLFKHKKSRNWTGQKMIAGNRFIRASGVPDKAAAIKKLTPIFDEIIESFSVCEFSPNNGGTIGDIFNAYMTLPIDVLHKSRKYNVCVMKTLMKRFYDKTDSEVLALPLKWLIRKRDNMTMFHWFYNYVSETKGLDNEAGRRYFNSILCNAKSVFSAKAMEHYNDDYCLAGMARVLNVKTLKVNRPSPKIPNNWEMVFTACHAHRHDNMNHWRIFMLASFAGLRPTEILNARWSWFSRGEHDFWLDIENEGSYLTKTKESRRVPISEDMYMEMMNHRHCDPVQTVIHGNGKAAMADFTKFLRGMGWTMAHPVKMLRKWFATEHTKHFDTAITQKLLGHKDQRSTEHYVDRSEITQALPYVIGS